ncbi:MAG: hypothetical protein ACRDK7_01960 [Solirubrobacteraceae bacterium]
MTKIVLCLVCVTSVFALAPAGAFGVPSEHPFELLPESFSLTPSSLQAGAHADWTLAFDLANHEGATYNDLRSTLVNYPTGFMGNGNSVTVPTCTITQLLANAEPGGNGTLCPVGSQVGTISLELTITGEARLVTVPVYNMEVTAYGVASELGFKTIIITQLLPVYVRPADSGLTGTSPNSEQTGDVHNVHLTVWGVPAAPSHDAQRGQFCGESALGACQGGGEKVPGRPTPFLANPTSCEAPLPESMKADSWEEPQSESWMSETVFSPGPRSAFSGIGPFTGCERLHFEPRIRVSPSTANVESPSGLGVTLEVAQNWQEAEDLVASNVKDVTVVLPEGYTVNPSDGNGLEGCSPEQYAAETASSASQCPSKSRIGTVKIETPLLAEPIEGSVYLATPYDNVSSFGDSEHPNGSLLALYVVAKEPQKGIVVKTAGKVTPNPVTGQLTSTFGALPQQPFTRVSFDLKQGATSPLVSPPTCGVFTVSSAMTPYADPTTAALSSGQLEIEHGIGGGACPADGTPPFQPRVIAGTQSNDAGSYSPFYLRIVRNDGEQEITKFSTTMPPGLSGNLSGIPFCPEADIEAARRVSGAEEIEHPSCPAASEVGHSITEAGVGTVLAQTPGKLYLAGPYHGAPLSLVSVTSAKVGPFDLGTVLIRFALFINPITAQVEVSGAQSDPIPHIIDGIVVHVRDIRAYVDRQSFMLNPTSCAPMTIQEAITGAGANPADPADQDTVPVSSRFQAADCASLKFQPTFKVTTSGKTSKADGASLTAKLTIPEALGTQSNIAKVKVDLPKQMPSRLTTLQKACTAAQFNANPAGCPTASVVGHAKAITPLIPVPLEGPAYFVSHGGEAFPSLIVVLQGYGITIDLVGTTFISKEGVTSSTFKTVPDQPVSSFELTLPQGPYSALAANGNLCRQKLAMPTEFVGQNGAQLKRDTHIEVEGCPDTLAITGHRIKKRTLTVKIYAPAAGRVKIGGHGLHSKTKTAKGRTTLTFKLRQKHAGRLHTRLRVVYTPTTGKARKRQVKTLKVRFKR